MTCSLHDVVWFEIQGIPALAIASSEFAEAALSQAQALGLENARRLFVPHPIQDATDSEMRAKADAVLDQLTTILEGAQGMGETSEASA